MERLVTEGKVSKIFKLLLRVGIGALCVGLIGFGLALSVGSDPELLRGKIGAAVALSAVVIGILITPIGIVLSLLDSRRQRRAKRDAEQELIRAAWVEPSRMAKTKSEHARHPE